MNHSESLLLTTVRNPRRLIQIEVRHQKTVLLEPFDLTSPDVVGRSHGENPKKSGEFLEKHVENVWKNMEKSPRRTW
jgi:hypothetical protein